MKGMLTWCARNRVAANFFMLMIFMIGFAAVTNIRRELIPQVSLDRVVVTVPYPGATPTEVEEGIIIRIEEAIADLEGIKEVSAAATEGSGVVTVEVETGYSTPRLLEQIKTRVDAISTFPDDSEQPVVEELTAKSRVINVVISGDTVDEPTLRHLADEVREDLLALEGITQVNLGGMRPYEIAIHVSEESLRRHGLTFDDVANAVRRSSLDLPAGVIRAGAGDILLRTRSQAYHGREFENMVVRARPDGTRLLVKDIATVSDGFDENELWARFNGRRAAILSIMSSKSQDVTSAARAVKEYVQKASHTLPQGVHLDTWSDMSRLYTERQDLMLRNGLQGLVLVFLSLTLFMRFRLAFWVALGMAVAFVGTFAVMILMDVSFNVISMAAFILVLGMVVDDAIVIAEAVHHHQTLGAEGEKGAVKGVLEVYTPVIFAVITTMIAFMPLLAISGVNGKFYRGIPIVIISCLLISLFEGLFILPAHLAHTQPRKMPWYQLPVWPLVAVLSKAQLAVDAGLQWFIDRVYRPVLDAAVTWRYLTLSLFVGAFVLVAGLVYGGWVQRSFFPRFPGDFAAGALDMPEGTNAAATQEVLARIEAAAFELRKRMDDDHPDKPPLFKNILVAMGSQPITRARDQLHGKVQAGGNHLAEVSIEFQNLRERNVSSHDLAEMWRDVVGVMPGVRKLTFTGEVGDESPDIHLRFASRDLGVVAQAADELKKTLAGYDGVHEISDTLGSQKQEITLAIRPDAEALGLRANDLARQVRQAFYGEEVQRVQRGRDEVRVFVRYPPDQRRSVGGLNNMRIRTAAGDEVPLGAVAKVAYGRGVAMIRRVDRRRVVDVTAKLDRTVLDNPEGIMRDVTKPQAGLMPALMKRFPDLTWTREGGMKEQARVLRELGIASIVALFAMYALMAIASKSYVQPVMIMLVIPFGMIGAVGGHIIAGVVISIISFLGIAALAGVVVNDSIVLIDAINTYTRHEGLSVDDAVRAAAVRRFRAILLTSLTTFLGLTPLMLETSVQAQFIIPMAVTLGFGVAFATTVTLTLIPSLYLMLEDARHLAHRIGAWVSPGEESPHQPDGPPKPHRMAHQTVLSGSHETCRISTAVSDRTAPPEESPASEETHRTRRGMAI